MPTRGGEAAQDARFAGFFGKMKWLGIEFAREFNDLFGRYRTGSVMKHSPRCEIFQPVPDFGHFELQLGSWNDLPDKRCFVKGMQVKFDLSDWQNRQARLLPILDEAAQAGLIPTGGAAKLGEFLLGRGVDVAAGQTVAADPDATGLDTPRTSEPVSPVEESEAPRFIRGFHDILITIGIIVALVGLGGLASIYAVIPAVIVLAEILVRRQRLALPAVVLTIAFVYAVGVGTIPLWDGINAADEAWLPAGLLATVAVAALVVYWRYRVPLALAGGLVAILAATAYCVGLAVRWLSGNAAFYEAHPSVFVALLGGFALAIFAIALRFDLADRDRVTRRSDVAFWMHLAAAPAILHTVVAQVYLGNADGLFSGNTSVLQAIAVVVAVTVLMLVGIVLDRRAFVTSGLLSFGYALTVLLSEGGLARLVASAETLVFLTLLAIGVVVLSLGIGWQPLRRVIVGNLPDGIRDLVPPVRG